VTLSRTQRFVSAKRLWLLGLVIVIAPVMLLLPLPGGEVAFINAQVLTLNSNSATASAVLVRRGRIVAVGSDDHVLDRASSAARVVDLNGRTMMPGFVDAHSHFPVSGLASSPAVRSWRIS